MPKYTLTGDEHGLVYIVLLNWNGLEDTVDCLESCPKLTYPNYRIIVVDNASAGNDAMELADRFPHVNVIELDINQGYAGGNNVGIQYALNQGADSVWLLNNDTVVEPNSLDLLVHELYASESVGCTGSKIYYFDMPDILWYAGGVVEPLRGIAGHVGQDEKDVGQHDVVRDVDYVTGCSLLVKREIFETVGLLDEDYYLLFEDTDFCFRIKKAGYCSRYVPWSMVWHKVSRSIGKESCRYEYYIYRNSLMFVNKLGLSTGTALRNRIRMLVLGLVHDHSLALACSRMKGILHYFLKRRGAMF